MSFYDRIADYYELSAGAAAQHREEALRMHALFQELGSQTVLDVACGTGLHVLELAALGYRCVGQDLSSGMLRVAEKKARERGVSVELVQGDMRQFDLNRSFDAVVALYALTNLESKADWDSALTCVHRALRANGVFLFNVLGPGAPPGRPVTGAPSPPRLFVGPIVEQGDVKLVRLNNLVERDGEWNLTGVYLIQDRAGARLEIKEDRLRLRGLDEVEGLLTSHGFRLGPVTYGDVLGHKRADMHVCAFRA